MSWSESLPTTPDASYQDMKVRIFLRHGLFALNDIDRLDAEDRQRVDSGNITEEMHYRLGLFPEGAHQAEAAATAILGRWAVHAVFFSPYKRTRQTASFFAGQGIPLHIAPELKERHRGIFAYQPPERLLHHPHYLIDESGTPKSDVLGWRPVSQYPHRPCETLYETAERVAPVLEHADALAPESVAVCVTSADILFAVRHKLAGFTSERLRQPLVANPPDDRPGLGQSNWAQNGQADVYYWGDPATGELADPLGPPAYFASFSATKPQFYAHPFALPSPD